MAAPNSQKAREEFGLQTLIFLDSGVRKHVAALLLSVTKQSVTVIGVQFYYYMQQISISLTRSYSFNKAFSV